MTSVAEIMSVKGENCTNICSQEYKRCWMVLSQYKYHTSAFLYLKAISFPVGKPWTRCKMKWSIKLC